MKNKNWIVETFVAVFAVVVFVVFVTGVHAADDPDISGYTFECRYGDRGSACFVIFKTDKKTVVHIATRGWDNTHKIDINKDANFPVKDSEQIQQLMKAALEKFEEMRKNDIKKTEFVRLGEYQIGIHNTNSPVSFGLLVPFPKETSTKMQASMDLAAMEHYIKILPGLPAAVKLVDERIGAAVK